MISKEMFKKKKRNFYKSTYKKRIFTMYVKHIIMVTTTSINTYAFSIIQTILEIYIILKAIFSFYLHIYVNDQKSNFFFSKI